MTEEKMTNKCGTCRYYIGCGDWNLCCAIKHPTPKEKGMTFILGICDCEESIRAKQLSDEIAELKNVLQSKTEELEALNKHYVGLRAFIEHDEEVKARLQKEE